jgi:hypothetical protein
LPIFYKGAALKRTTSQCANCKASQPSVKDYRHSSAFSNKRLSAGAILVKRPKCLFSGSELARVVGQDLRW